MKNIECRLKLPVFQPDSTFAHVAIINPQICRGCTQSICLTICPSMVFYWNFKDEDQPIIVNYKQCIECGACRLVCPHNNIRFQYPNGGYGVCFNDGTSIYLASDDSLISK